MQNICYTDVKKGNFVRLLQMLVSKTNDFLHWKIVQAKNLAGNALLRYSGRIGKNSKISLNHCWRYLSKTKDALSSVSLTPGHTFD